MRQRITTLAMSALVTALLCTTVYALGDPLTPAAGPDNTNSYTLEQIYQRLTTGSYFAQQNGFTEPASGPTSGTMHTLDEIMAVAQPRALAPRVAKTGHTQCYDGLGNLIDCAGTGQDGEYQLGVDPEVAPTSGLTGAYNTPAWTGVRFTDNGDGTVTDNLTALIWLKEANCFGRKTWETALSNANGLASGSYGLSDGSSAGDWRLANTNELHSLVDLTQNYPALPAGHPFTGVQSNNYWSSTSVSSNSFNAFSVNLSLGYVTDNGKPGSNYFWPVRGGD